MPQPRLQLVLTLLAALCLAPAAQAFDTVAQAAYVVDVTSGTVLFEKNADEPMPPASMSKLMTVDLLFEALEDGRVHMDTAFPVSSKARAMGGSTMFLNERDRPTVEQLIQGILVLSGNDACVVVAEGLAGSEAAFAEQMNIRAKALGLTHSHFANASGWPDPGQLMSMHDLATLAVHLIKTYPQYYHYFSQEVFEYDGRAPANVDNRNPLLGVVEGADGMKTGHTEASGFGLVGTAKQGDRRVLVVLNGLPTAQARGSEGERILNWAFRQFVERKIAAKGALIPGMPEVPVWMGSQPSVAVVPAEDTVLLTPVAVRGTIDAKVVYDRPLEAPVAAGQQIAELVVALPDMEERRIPLVAAEDVARGGFLTRIGTAASVLLRNLAGAAQGL